MQRDTVRKYYNNCWYLRDFDYLPAHLSEHPQLSGISQDFIQNRDNSIALFYSLEDACQASFNIRQILNIRNPEYALSKLEYKTHLYDTYGIDEKNDKHIENVNFKEISLDKSKRKAKRI